MKKVLPILLVLCLCFAFFACGKKDDAGTGDSGSKDTTPAATVADANDETDETTAAEPADTTAAEPADTTPAAQPDADAEYCKVGGLSVPIPAGYVDSGTNSGAKYYVYSANGDVITVLQVSSGSTVASVFETINKDMLVEAYQNNASLAECEITDYTETQINGVPCRAAHLQKGSLEGVDMYFLTDEAIVEVCYLFNPDFDSLFQGSVMNITKG